MFSSQGESSDFDFPRGPLKRYHEDEAAAEGINGATIGFTEHRNKRLHTLPLRTSPSSRKWNLPFGDSSNDVQRRQEPAMTPPGSFSEDPANIRMQQEQAAAHMHQSLYSQQGSTPTVVESGDMDMDMTSDSYIDSSSYDAYATQLGRHLAPGAPQPDQDSVIAGRMPTPIQPSFAVQVRGNNWGGAAGNIMHTSMQQPTAGAQAVLGETDMHTGYIDRSVPRSLDQPAAMGEWSMVQNRSLPSPISESGGEETGNPDMVLDSMALQEHDHFADHDHDHDHGHERGGSATPTRSSAMLNSSPGSMVASSPIRGSYMDSDPSATPSPRKGHTRSRHTVVAWTQQPGMKKSFSIGYRSDCEKCRNRVPGHFNHIIVS